MSEWKKVKITFPTIKLGDFIEPIKTTVGNLEDTKLQAYGVTNKEGIVITGKEPSEDKSKYIVLENNCFAFNPYRINVGSIGLNDKNIEGCVSPAYVVFKTINGLIPKFLFYYLKSEFGNHLINWYGNRGGVRNALRYSDLCNIDIPDITKLNQLDILKKLNAITMQTDKLFSEIDKQKSYAKQLRQSVLQDAIEGKLTTDWRKSHPVEKGNPDYDTEALFQKIQEEKEKQATGKKNVKFQIPSFEENLGIPSEWKLTKFGDISKQITDGTHQTPNYVDCGEIFLSAQNVKPFKFLPNNHRFVSKSDFDSFRNNRVPETHDLLIGRVGAGIGECAVIDIDLNFAFYVSLALVKLFPKLTKPKYLALVMNSQYGINYAKNNTSSSGTSAGNFNLGHIRSFGIPLPPLAEQSEIVRRVETELDKITQLEQQITTREELTKQLMRNILREAFEGEK